MKTIACVGSRETPEPILAWMEEFGAALIRAGYWIRSGNSPGADQAWARGANTVHPARVTLCLPWENFEPHAIHQGNPVRVIHSTSTQHQRYYDAVKSHPAFGRLKASDLNLHARNAMIVEDVHLVLGSLNPYKPGGGGTGGAFRIAQRWKIFTLNVADTLVRGMLTKRLSKGEDVRGPTYDTGKGKKW